MNKTVNINLAGTFFHIDEDAYGKLQRYLVAIKKSLSDPQGSDEIIKDIEARIAELFSEKLELSTQVVTIKELDQVIGVMGQPEDYMVDEEIFEDAPPKATKRHRPSHKQLFRDEDHKFIAGVSAGLSHYLGLDAIWVRLIWILLTLFSSGIFIVVYILFWILVPVAATTSDKLKMTGEPINISNIEKKFKEGYENVSEKVKNVDYDKYGNKVKSGTSSFFDTLGSILLTLFKIFVKIIGIFIVFISLVTLVSWIIFIATAGSYGVWGDAPFMDMYHLIDTTNAPVWLVGILALFAVGIPFFALFILGLKMLINNLKSIGNPAKIVLFVVWIASIIGLSILGVRQMTDRAFDGEFTQEVQLPIKSGDSISITMVSNERYDFDPRRNDNTMLEYDEDGNRLIYSTDVRLIVRSTKDSVGRMVIEKRAEGRDFAVAKKRAEAINYNYSFDGKTLGLDAYLTTDESNKMRDQEVDVILYLPIGTILYADDNTYSYHRNDSRFRDILDNGDENQYLLIEDGETRCLDCPKKVENDYDDDNSNNFIKESSSSNDWDDADAIYVKDENGNFVKIPNEAKKVIDTLVEPAAKRVVLDSSDI